MSGDFTDSARTQWTLNGAGIRCVTFCSQCDAACGENLAIDDLSSPQLSAVGIPEPSTLMLLFAGVLGLIACRSERVRRQFPV